MTVEQVSQVNVNRSIAAATTSLTIAELAALAANVYFPKDSYEDGCDPTVSRRVIVPGWTELSGYSRPAACNANLSDIEYEVWGKYNAEDDVMHVAIVFRGTVPSTVVHWCSNLRAFRIPGCKAELDQYLAIAPLVDAVVDGIREDYGPATYAIAIGHSLGGGLAELAARSSYITTAVAFNSSPVVGTDIDRLLQQYKTGTSKSEALSDSFKCTFANNNPAGGSVVSVHRVYEHGDVLQFPRYVDELLADPPPRTQYRSYRLNVTSGNPIAQHSMKALACNMSR
jgi:pimeloyl-ACP methyl ester carboxylesterase